MEPALFTWAFVAALLLSLGVKFWLATRQMRHVAAHRDQVPAAFAGTVTLPAHRKAADYTLAKGRFGLLTTAFGAAVLLGWTLLGGLDALNALLRDLVQPAWGDLAYQLALLAAFAAIGGLLDLPLEWYGTFRIEQRFGFNRMTLKHVAHRHGQGHGGGRRHRAAAGRAHAVDHGRRRADCGGCGPGSPGWASTWPCWCCTPPSSRRSSTSSSRWPTTRCALACRR